MVKEKKLLYYLLWIFCLILLFALATNFVVLCPSPIKIKIAGDVGDWIGYYAGVSANLISSIMAFTILYITYKQNERSHEDLKKFQIKNTIYALERERLSQIETILKDEMTLLSPLRLSMIVINNGEIKDNFINYLKYFTDELQRTENEAIFFITIYNDSIGLSKLQIPRLKLVELFNKTTTTIRNHFIENGNDISIEYFQNCIDEITKSNELFTYQTTLFEIIKEAENKLYLKMADATS